MLDIVILVLLGIAGYRGFKDGIIMEIFSFLAVFVGLIASVRFLHPAMELMAPHVRNAGSTLPFLTFTVVFSLVFLVIFLAGKTLKSVMKMTVMGNVDQFGGALLGMLKAGFVLGILFWLGSLVNIGKVLPWVSDSFMANLTSDFASGTINIVNTAVPIKEIFEKVKHILQGTKAGGL